MGKVGFILGSMLEVYRFRVVSAATLYPFRVYIHGHNELTIRASDGFEIVTGVKEDSMEITVFHHTSR